MVDVKFEMTGRKEVRNFIQLKRRNGQEEIKKAVQESALTIESLAKKEAPVDTGTLRSSIQTTFRKNGMEAEIGSDKAYAPFIEFGTSPHFPPPSALEAWAERHGFERGFAFAIAKKISEKGTRPQPFLIPAFEKEKNNFIKKAKVNIGKLSE